MLTEPPFTNLDDQGLFGIFEEDNQSFKIINLVEAITKNADVA